MELLDYQRIQFDFEELSRLVEVIKNEQDFVYNPWHVDGYIDAASKLSILEIMNDAFRIIFPVSNRILNKFQAQFRDLVICALDASALQQLEEFYEMVNPAKGIDRVTVGELSQILNGAYSNPSLKGTLNHVFETAKFVLDRINFEIKAIESLDPFGYEKKGRTPVLSD